jgi:hypothetical protein
MTDEPKGPANNGARPPTAVQIYQIIAQTVLGGIGVGGYIAIVLLIILHTGEWTVFQQNQVSGVLQFLAGTIVGGVFNYAFGSSFGSMAKDSLRRDEEKRP